MIALYPSPRAAADLAIPDGEEASQLHVTLVYLGSDAEEIQADRDLVADLRDACAAVAAAHAPVTLSEAGTALFGGRDGSEPAAVVLLDGAQDLHDDVRAALAELDRHFPSKFPGYRAHLTLRYGPRPEVARVLGSREPGPPFVGDRLGLAIGGEYEFFPLRGRG
jgi:2'-5' RNA ligase